LKLRLLTEGDSAAAKNLWSNCFETEKEPFFQWFFGRRYQPENALGAFGGAGLLGALHIMPYTLFLRGSAVPSGYLMGVGTYPEYRGRGIMASLLREALLVMRQRGQWMSFLVPRRPSLYIRHGWDICCYHYKYSMPAGLLRPRDVKYEAVAIQDYGKDEFDELDSVYQAYTQDKHGYVLRSGDDWRNILSENKSENGEAYLIRMNDNPVAYVLYLSTPDKLLVKEMAYISAPARDALLSFIAGKPSSATRTEWQLPVSDLTYLQFADNKEGICLYPFIAGRIVDLVQVVERLSFPQNVAGSVRMRIKDGLAPWNDGCFTLDVREGSGRISQAGDPQVELTIGSFTQLVFGMVDIEDLIASGAVKLTDPEAVTPMALFWPGTANFNNDSF
jgi:predicted acetyltransferase